MPKVMIYVIDFLEFFLGCTSHYSLCILVTLSLSGRKGEGHKGINKLRTQKDKIKSIQKI